MSAMRPKVFGIGLNKTGTSSLDSALKILGYTVTGPNRRFMADVLRGRTDGVLALTEQFDAFQDFPWPLLFEQVFEKYGADARYILTVRESPEVWLRSLKNHLLQGQVGKIVLARPFVYGPRYPFGFEAEYIRYYNTHNERVREFFEARGAAHLLLEVCWEQGAGWQELCGFLGHEVPDAPFPHSNATAVRKWRRSRQIANGVAAHMLALLKGRRVKERLFSGPIARK